MEVNWLAPGFGLIVVATGITDFSGLLETPNLGNTKSRKQSSPDSMTKTDIVILHRFIFSCTKGQRVSQDQFLEMPSKIISGAEDPAKCYTVVISLYPLPSQFWVQM